jgi:hypothetical protein
MLLDLARGDMTGSYLALCRTQGLRRETVYPKLDSASKMKP